ncbi:PP2C family serine/threonine-protein phosphatase [Ktedonobacter sp. SOSP1-52]|uniref:PP2C family protein-serine/threonine phosphatase n=1 Tax=Ktedonobacter sp. SOSP1-52 TaxID=2778366 RepID=UPI001915B43A|nr:protein phosphatase 2C domain-containing protein [Ktedonobacter sp. SOSP1-52]
MLEELKAAYDLHVKLRWCAWCVLVLLPISFVLLGGFPPRTWSLCLQALLSWSMHWQEMMYQATLVVLVLASLFWFIAWGGLLWLALWLVVHHLQFRPVADMSSVQAEWQPLPMSTSPTIQKVPSASLPGLVELTPYRGSESLTAQMQRIRLPQRTPQMQAGNLALNLSPFPSVHPSLPDRSAPPSVATMVELPEIPTRPAGRSATDPLSSRLSMLEPLEVGIGWNSGIVRMSKPNEDSVMVLQGTCTYEEQLMPFALFVVADGMGGHDNGRDASRLAMQSMMHTVLQNIVMSRELSDEFLIDMLIGGVEWANRAIMQRGRELNGNMGTTLTASLVVGLNAYIVNVGDSRTYLYREGFGLKQVTRDHSVVATLVAFGEITPEEVYTHPERNKVYRSLGQDEHIEVDWFMLNLLSQDRLLLCSDGLWEMVRNPEIARLLQQYPNAVTASDALTKAALIGGGVDNISVIVARVP